MYLVGALGGTALLTSSLRNFDDIMLAWHFKICATIKLAETESVFPTDITSDAIRKYDATPNSFITY